MDMKKYVGGVSQLLYGWISAFPRNIVHGDPRFKCTNGWFTAIYGKCATGKVMELLGENTLDFYNEMERDFRETNMYNRPTTREDVRKGDRLLWMILKDCENQKHLKMENNRD